MCFFLLAFLLFSASGSKTPSSERTMGKLYYNDKFMDWESAQAYCRKHHTDLITLRNEKENQYFIEARGWIGLFRENAASQWKWSHGNETANYNAFASEPSYDEHCVFTTRDSETWITDPCGKPHTFTCVDENLVLVKENKTWEEALDHCRSLGRVNLNDPNSPSLNSRYDLTSLITNGDHIIAREKAQYATTDEVWTGLRFLAGQWWWVDQEPMLYEGIDSCPTHKSCGVIEKKGAADFSTRNCAERRNFMCFKRI